LVLTARGLVAAAGPEVAVGIGVGDPDRHEKGGQGRVVLLLLIEGDAFLEIGVAEFPVAADAGVELRDRLFVLAGIGIEYPFYKERIDQLMGGVLFQD